MVRNIVKNVVALGFNGGIRVLFGMVVQVLIARALGAEGLGKFAVMTAYIAIFQVVMQLGLPNLLIREVARHREDASHYWWSTVLVLIAAGAGAWGLQVLVATLWGHPQDTYQMVVVAGASLVPFGVVIGSEATLRGLERMEVIPTVQTVAYTVYALAVLLVVSSGWSVVALGWAMVALQGTGATLYVLYLTYRRVVRRPQVDPGLARDLLRQAPHFYGLPLAAIVPNRVGIIIIAKILGEEASGIFNAAQLLARALFFVSTGYSEALYPALSRLYLAGMERFRQGVKLGIYYGVVFSATLSLTMMAWAPLLVDVVFDAQEYQAAVPILQVLTWQAVLFVLNGVMGVVEMAANRQDLTFYIAVAKVVIFLVVIPIATLTGGLMGAAVGVLLSSGASVALHSWAVQRVAQGLPSWQMTLRALGVIVLGVVTTLLTRKQGLWVASAVPLVVYGVGLVLFGVIRREDVSLLVAQFARRAAPAVSQEAS